MKLVWERKKPQWVPMINIASQMLLLPEINDRPLFMNGKDWFGVEWEIDPDHPEFMTHVIPGKYLFDDITEWQQHVSFPSSEDLDWEGIEARTKAMWYNSDEVMGYFVGNMGAFEKVNAMMGFENGLCALYEEADYIEFVNAYADYRIGQFKLIKKHMNADYVMMHDDWGNQNNMFMPPDTWRRIFKEPERRMVEAAHEFGMYYMHHSCGFIEPIIGDMVEIGVDSWHSVSPVNNLAKIKAEYGDRLIFAGGIDPQVTDALDATEDQIRAEVRKTIDLLGKDGGYMCSSAVMFSTSQGVDEIIDDEGTKYGKYNEQRTTNNEQ